MRCWRMRFRAARAPVASALKQEKGDAWRISRQMVRKTALLGTRTQAVPVEMGEMNWLVHSARIAESEEGRSKGVVARRIHWAQTVL